jgi:YfiH family protein
MTMYWKNKRELQYLQHPLLTTIPGVWHGILARFTSNRHRNRQPFHVPLPDCDLNNSSGGPYRQLLSLCGANYLVFAKQVHGNTVAVWNRTNTKNTSGEPKQNILKGDALVTNITDAALVIRTADCQSVLIVDPAKRVIGNVHSGWRGSVANIIDETIEVMASRFGCRPDNCYAAIGPSLGPCCAEFVNFRKEIPRRYWSYRLEKDHFDFWQLSIDQLIAAGVPRQNITSSGICTRCNQHAFYSFRGERDKAGRFATIVRLT